MKILGRIFLVLSLLVVSFSVATQPVFAADCTAGQSASGCTCRAPMVIQGGYCVPTLNSDNGSLNPNNGAATTNVFGNVEAPPGVAQYNAGSSSGIGLIPFISTLIRIATIVAGVIVFINFILAGYAYISSDGSSKVNEQVRNQLTFSVIGLVIIVASYTIIAIISLLLFGKADFILNPTISGPTQ